jgi:hypothetical protein
MSDMPNKAPKKPAKKTMPISIMTKMEITAIFMTFEISLPVAEIILFI